MRKSHTTNSIPYHKLFPFRQGGSGSGKTTLLNLIAGRIRGDVTISGVIEYNGKERSKSDIIDFSAYVKQTDFLHGELTVMEALRFSALMALPGDMTFEEKIARVEMVIQDLGLKHVADSPIGTEWKRGLSGGERRRVSIGEQLLTRPAIMFFDEPTTGLDSFTAHNIIETLGVLAKTGSVGMANRITAGPTILVAIHQPRSDTFREFDRVILMSKGRVAYSGLREGLMAHFNDVGFAFPLDCNPADHAITVTSIDNRSSMQEAKTRRIVDQFVEKTAADFAAAAGGRKPSALTDGEDETVIERTKANYFTQVYELTRRQALVTYRNKLIVLGSLAEMLIMAAVLGSIYLNLENTVAGMVSRKSLVFLTCCLQPYLTVMFQCYLLSKTLLIFDHEREEGMYSTSVYLISTNLAQLPANILFPMVHGAIIHWAAGLRGEVGDQYFWVYVMGTVMTHFWAMGLGLMCTAVHRNFRVSTSLANGFLFQHSLASGFYAQTTSVGAWISWVSYTTPMWYMFRLLAWNEFADNQYECILPGVEAGAPDERCGADALRDGNFILKSLDFDSGPDDWQVPLLGSVCCIVAYNVLSLLLLKYTSGRFLPSMSAAAIEKNTEQESNVVKRIRPTQTRRSSIVALIGRARTRQGKQPVRTIPEVELQEVGRYRFTSDVDGTNEAGDKELPAESSEVDVDALAASVLDALEAPPDPRPPPPSPPDHDAPEEKIDDAEQLSIVKTTALERHPGVTVTVKSMTLSTPNRQILQQINCTMKPGELWALMGTSGSGKSSLLSVIAGRIGPGMQVRGTVSLNGEPADAASVLANIAMVPQHDHMHASLSVRETLTFSSKLVSGKKISQEVRTQHVEKIITELSLKDCAETRIGDEQNKGLSGGEKRRVSMALRMLPADSKGLTSPGVMLLDEPTSGLDSFTAATTVDLMRELADANRTVVAAIHQPASEVFHAFDSLMVLTNGQVVYNGPSGDIHAYFSSFTYVPQCPNHTNPADWLLDISSVDRRSARREIESSDRVARLQAAMIERRLAVAADERKASPVLPPTIGAIRDMISGTTTSPRHVVVTRGRSPIGASLRRSSALKRRESIDTGISIQKDRVEPPGTWKVVLERLLLNQIRNPSYIIQKMLQAPLLAIVLFIYYYPLENEQFSIQNRNGLLYNCSGLVFCGMLNGLANFYPERDVFFRERQDATAYSAQSFVLAYTVAEVPTEIVSALIYTLLSWGLGLNLANFGNFMLYWLVCTCFLFTGECISMLFGAFIYQPGFAVSLMSTTITIMAIMSGFLVTDLQNPFPALNFFSVLRYGSSILAIGEFDGLTLTCTDEQLISVEMVPICPVTVGNQVLEVLNFKPEFRHWDIIAMVVLCVV